MGKSKPKPKRYQCLIWLQSPVDDSPIAQTIVTQINAVLEQEDITVHQHLDTRIGVDTGDFYSVVITEGIGINPARLQELLAHLGQPLVQMRAIKATAPSESAAAPPEPRPAIHLDQKELRQS